MAEVWEVAVYFAAMVLYVVLVAWLYWRTSDEYRIKKRRKELGYAEEDVSIWQVCCALCLGPINRKRWESKHKYFRTCSYGDADPNWMVLGHSDEPNQQWQKLPRGDTDHIKKVAARAVAKVVLKILEDEYNAALNQTISAIVHGTNKKEKEKLKTIKPTAPSEMQRALEKENRRESIWEDDIKREEELDEFSPVTPFEAEKKRSMLRANKRSSHGIINPLIATSATGVTSTAVTAGVVGKSGGSRRRSSHILPVPTAIASSSAEDIKGLTHRMTVKDLRSLVNAMDADSLEEEHLLIPLFETDPKEYGQKYLRLNRSEYAAPNPRTRVQLKPPKGLEYPTDYIHANFVRGHDGKPGKFIITQTPLSGHENGKANTREHFWTMVWNYKVSTIVMLIRPSAAHCPFYWPSGTRHQTARFGPFTISFIHREDSSGIVRTELSLSCQGSNTSLLVNHYMYKGWPTSGVPQGSSGLITLLKKVKLSHSDEGPVVVMDEFGTGPAGVFVAAAHLTQALKRKGEVDVLKTVATLRMDRGGIVNELEQYQFLHKMLAIYSITNRTKAAPAKSAPPAYNAPPKAQGSARR